MGDHDLQRASGPSGTGTHEEDSVDFPAGEGNVDDARRDWSARPRGTTQPAELKLFGSQVEELILSWPRRTRPDDDLDADGVERRPVLAFFHAFPSEP